MTHHGAGLRKLTKDPELARQLAADYRRAPVSDADRAMLDYADKLTREPWAMKEADLEPLRSAGFDDRAILDIAQSVAYFAFVNRLADGLGVELEAYWDPEEILEPSG